METQGTSQPNQSQKSCFLQCKRLQKKSPWQTIEFAFFIAPHSHCLFPRSRLTVRRHCNVRQCTSKCRAVWPRHSGRARNRRFLFLLPLLEQSNLCLALSNKYQKILIYLKTQLNEISWLSRGAGGNGDGLILALIALIVHFTLVTELPFAINNQRGRGRLFGEPEKTRETKASRAISAVTHIHILHSVVTVTSTSSTRYRLIKVIQANQTLNQNWLLDGAKAAGVILILVLSIRVCLYVSSKSDQSRQCVWIINHQALAFTECTFDVR